MNSPSEVRADKGRMSRRGAVLTLVVLLGGLALGVMALLLQQQGGLGFGVAALVATALCTASLLLFVAALGWHVGVRLTRQRLGESLREARVHAHTLAQLQPDWQWATDAEHHLVRWQAPQGLPSSAWVGVTATATLWQRFECEAADALAESPLQARLQAQANFADLVVCARDAPIKRWRLRGIACFDGAGHFAGFQGTAQVLAAGPVVLPAPPTHGWLDAWPGPAWLLTEGATPTVVAANEAAAERGMRAGEAWDAARAVAADDGSLSLRSFDDGDERQMVALLMPAAAAVTSTSTELQETAAQTAAFEHASFSYTVSHDLRAPLRVVEGFARILKEDYGRLLDRIGNDHLDRVMGAAARMNSMIDALLSLSQLSTQPLARQPVNLSQLAGFVMEELRRNAPERAVDVQIEPGLQVQGDPTLLRMVLENLLGNAWKYSSKRPLAQIRLEAHEQEGQWVHCVSDNGAGFDMRFADRLFGVFQRLHSASDFQGTGVGLASVRRIVRRHGGDVWAESSVDDGARFYFTLANSSTASISRKA